MLFALLDYLKYRARKGPYSTAAIRAQGGRLAVPENCPGFENFGPEYLFVYHRANSFTSWAVMYYTSSVWSHVGKFSENGNVIDATTGGVIEHPFADYFDGKSFVTALKLKEPITDQQRTAMLKWGRERIGDRFGWEKIVLFFFAIVFGAHESYRFRFSADFAILALALSPIALLSKRFGLILGALAVLYVLTVMLNTPKRRRMAKILVEQGIFRKAGRLER